MMRWTRDILAGVALSWAITGAIAAEQRPAILVLSPQGASPGYVDLSYLAELTQSGFEVDYLDNFAQLTWDRIKNYNVLIVYMTPDAYDVVMSRIPSSPEKVKAFADLMEKYVEAGGGVFLMPAEYNILKQVVSDLTDHWGAKLPMESIEETDPEKVGTLTHAPGTKLAFTDQVLPSPVSDGVKQIWYPYAPVYNAAQGGPIWVDQNWQVVVKASPTSATKPVDISKAPTPIKDPFIRPEGVKAPPLFAIRQYKGGRLALVNQWCQFTLGSGTKWIFNREVLSRGVKGKPSDFGRLMENTFRWLAEPSLKSGKVGGYVTAPDRMMPPNYRPEIKKQFDFTYWHYERDVLGYGQPPKDARVFRGLIGAKSACSSGAGTVEEYAKAAGESGLDFLVFMEDFDKLTPASFQKLKDDCRKLSSTNLLLLAGFTIPNNIGNRLFFFGPDPVLPPDLILTGPDKKIYYMQQEDGKGGFTGLTSPHLDWVLQNYHGEKGQVGYYDFASSPHGMKLSDCRLYAMAGVRYYRDGKLVEDVTDEYLKTAQGTIPPAPVSINEVTSPAALAAEVKSSHALTFAQARSLDTLMSQALRWTCQYDAVNVFFSDGPQILAWPACHRVITYGGEEFVTAPAVMPSPIFVTAEKGLKEVRIYNGQNLFRRFILKGTNAWHQTLVLDGTVQKNLVLVAEDMAGGRAVSYARRCWKDGALAPVFCSDHVNDGGHCYLAHGPLQYQVNFPPSLPDNRAGGTWDGGPRASLPLGYQNTIPYLESDKGKEDGARFNQTPLLEFSDEGAVAVRSPRSEVFDERVKQVYNPWHNYGPIAGPSKIFEYVISYREFVTPTVDVPHSGWAGPGVRVGVNPSLFINEMTFKQDVKVLRRDNPKDLAAFYFGTFCRKKTFLVLGSAAGVQTIDLSQLIYPTYPIRTGDWFGIYSDATANSHLFINRGDPFRIFVGAALIFIVDEDDKQIKKGEKIRFELAALGFPVNVRIRGAADFQRYVDYLARPEGLLVLRGSRFESPGLVELTPVDHAVEFYVPAPLDRLDLTLPVRVRGLNTRWSAGLFQKKGYTLGYYGSGTDRYRALGLDLDGNAYVPVYVDYSAATWMVIGHPVVAGPEGKDLFIQVTKVGDNPYQWHVSVNNPTDKAITTQLRKTMDLPGLTVDETAITLGPGEYRVMQ
ncbi:MAG: hypothetical protein KKD33_03470 [Verrucomicrobia bacterium]|nr:hypothetical protein [Verrucomicrobiota bacterium]